MAINFESTMTEADFKKPLLDSNEAQLARELRGGDADFTVDGLRSSFFASFLATIFGDR